MEEPLPIGPPGQAVTDSLCRLRASRRGIRSLSMGVVDTAHGYYGEEARPE